MRTKAKCHPDQPVHKGTQCHSCYQRDKRRDAMLRKKYSITLSLYNQLLDYQRGVCATCGRKPKTRSLAVDHNHDTGEPRGLVCWHCNSAIKWMRDDPDTAIMMYNYLTKPPLRRFMDMLKSTKEEPLTWIDAVDEDQATDWPLPAGRRAKPPEKYEKMRVVEPGKLGAKTASHEANIAESLRNSTTQK
jgi:hypothetical protein